MLRPALLTLALAAVALACGAPGPNPPADRAPEVGSTAAGGAPAEISAWAGADRETTAAPQAPRSATSLPGRLWAPAIGLAVRVTGTYTDPAGQAPVPAGVVLVDARFPDRVYFIAHNPGVFTPLMRASLGTEVDFEDGEGRVLAWHVLGIHEDWPRWNGPPPMTPGSVAQLQTCATPDASVDRVVDVG